MTDAEARLHAWAIEPREYARQEERRGRRHAYAALIPGRTALVVVDMVPFFVTENPYCRGIVPNIARLAERLRLAGGSVAWVLPKASPPSAAAVAFFGERIAALYAASGGTGPPKERLWHGLDVHDSDLLIEKSAASAFFPGSSSLAEALHARGIDTVLVTGTVTNICCESTARDASTLGFRVVMVADANAARRDQDHNATLYNIYRSFGDVRPTDAVIEMITSSITKR